MSFGTQLRLARKRKKLTQRALAQAVGAKHNSVSNWESGHSRPDAETIRALCALLEVDPNWFFEADPPENQLSGVEFALFGEVRELTEQDQRDVLEFIRYKKALREKRQQE